MADGATMAPQQVDITFDSLGEPWQISEH